MHFTLALSLLSASLRSLQCAQFTPRVGEAQGSALRDLVAANITDPNAYLTHLQRDVLHHAFFDLEYIYIHTREVESGLRLNVLYQALRTGNTFQAILDYTCLGFEGAMAIELHCIPANRLIFETGILAQGQIPPYFNNHHWNTTKWTVREIAELSLPPHFQELSANLLRAANSAPFLIHNMITYEDLDLRPPAGFPVNIIVGLEVSWIMHKTLLLLNLCQELLGEELVAELVPEVLHVCLGEGKMLSLC